MLLILYYLLLLISFFLVSFYSLFSLVGWKQEKWQFASNWFSIFRLRRYSTVHRTLRAKISCVCNSFVNSSNFVNCVFDSRWSFLPFFPSYFLNMYSIQFRRHVDRYDAGPVRRVQPPQCTNWLRANRNTRVVSCSKFRPIFLPLKVSTHVQSKHAIKSFFCHMTTDRLLQRAV